MILKKIYNRIPTIYLPVQLISYSNHQISEHMQTRLLKTNSKLLQNSSMFNI